MTMMTHTHTPHLLQDHSGTTDVSNAAMIKRFVKFVLAMTLFAVVLVGIMVIRVVAWFPPFHH